MAVPFKFTKASPARTVAHSLWRWKPDPFILFVDDLVDGIVKLLYSDEHYPVNIGNPVEMTILQFAETVNKVTGNTAGITYIDDARSARDPQRRRPDITRAHNLLSWKQRLANLEEGVRRTIPFFKQRLGIE